MKIFPMNVLPAFLSALILLFGGGPVRAQNILGKHPSDKFLNAFWNQNNNASNLVQNLNLRHGTNIFEGELLGSGWTLDSTYFLSADGTWRVPAGGGGGSGTTYAFDTNHFNIADTTNISLNNTNLYFNNPRAYGLQSTNTTLYGNSGIYNYLYLSETLLIDNLKITNVTDLVATNLSLQTSINTNAANIVIVSNAVNRNVSVYTNVSAMVADASTNVYRYTVGMNNATDSIDGDWVYDSASSDATNYIVRAHVSGTGRIKRIVKDKIAVEWFGAVGDGSTDDSAAIQRAIDYAIPLTRKPKIVLRNKSYALQAPLIFYDFNSGTNGFDQVFGMTFEVESGMTPALSHSAELYQLNTNYPCVILQYVDSIEFKNIHFRGVNTALAEGRLGTVNQLLYETNYISAANNVRTNRYGPHAGVVSDPFSSDSTLLGDTNNMYQGYTNFYIGTTGGSARVKFVDCYAYNLVAGWVMNPNPAANLLQGDQFTFDNCGGKSLREAIVTCQSQSKNVVINNANFSYVGTFVSTRKYGKQLGAPPAIRNGQVGNCRWLFDVDPIRGKFIVDGLFSENVCSLGIIGSGVDGSSAPVSIRNSVFNFASFTTLRPDHMGFFAAPMAVEDSTFVVFGSNVLNFANGLNSTVLSDQNYSRVKFAVLGKTQSQSSVLFTSTRNVRFDNCQLFDNDLDQDSGKLTEYFKTQTISDMNRHFFWWGSKFTHGPTNYVGEYNITDIEAGIGEFTFGGDGTGTCTTGGDAFSAEKIRVGDNIVNRQSRQIYDAGGDGVVLASVIDAYVGTVRTIDASGNMTLIDVPKCWTNGMSLTSNTIRRTPRFHQPTTADFTSGSYSITNVSNPTAWAVGDAIRSPYLAEGAVVTNISGSTFMTTRAATATATGVSIYDARYHRVYDEGSSNVPISAVSGQVASNLLFNAKQPGNTALTNLAALSNSAGVLTNNGSGGLSWVTISGGGGSATNAVSTWNGLSNAVTFAVATNHGSPSTIVLTTNSQTITATLTVDTNVVAGQAATNDLFVLKDSGRGTNNVFITPILSGAGSTNTTLYSATGIYGELTLAETLRILGPLRSFGDGPNWFATNLTIGATNAATVALDVTGAIKSSTLSTNTILKTGANTKTVESLANASGVLTNNGTSIGWSTNLTLDNISATTGNVGTLVLTNAITNARVKAGASSPALTAYGITDGLTNIQDWRGVSSNLLAWVDSDGGVHAQNFVARDTGFFGNGANLTNIPISGVASLQASLDAKQATLVPFATNSVVSAATNWVIICSNYFHRGYIAATNSVNLTGTNQGFGGVLIKASGGDRLITFPTNSIVLNTNELTVTGAYYSITLTNSKAMLISIERMTDTQTNTIWGWKRQEN